MTSLDFDDVLKLAQSSVASNVTLATQAADSDFIFANRIQTKLQSSFPAISRCKLCLHPFI